MFEFVTETSYYDVSFTHPKLTFIEKNYNNYFLLIINDTSVFLSVNKEMEGDTTDNSKENL